MVLLEAGAAIILFTNTQALEQFSQVKKITLQQLICFNLAEMSANKKTLNAYNQLQQLIYKSKNAALVKLNKQQKANMLKREWSAIKKLESVQQQTAISNLAATYRSPKKKKQQSMLIFTKKKKSEQPTAPSPPSPVPSNHSNSILDLTDPLNLQSPFNKSVINTPPPSPQSVHSPIIAPSTPPPAAPPSIPSTPPPAAPPSIPVTPATALAGHLEQCQIADVETERQKQVRLTIEKLERQIKEKKKARTALRNVKGFKVCVCSVFV